MKIINCIIYSLVSYIIIINDLLAQTTGDYRSTETSIKWSNANDWQTWNGSNWVTASSAPGSGNDVYIQAGHTATLTGNQSCNSIFISTGTTDATNGGDGKVVLQSYTLNLSGKLSCYFGNIDITVNSTTPLSITPENTTPTLPISKSTGGLLKFIGNTRDLTVTGEWSGNATGSPTLFDIEISLNTGQVGTLYTVVKAANWLISSGTLETSQRISVDTVRIFALESRGGMSIWRCRIGRIKAFIVPTGISTANRPSLSPRRDFPPHFLCDSASHINCAGQSVLLTRTYCPSNTDRTSLFVVRMLTNARSPRSSNSSRGLVTCSWICALCIVMRYPEQSRATRATP